MHIQYMGGLRTCLGRITVTVVRSSKLEFIKTLPRQRHSTNNLLPATVYPSFTVDRHLCSMSEWALERGQECPPVKEGVLRLYSMRFCPYAQRTRLLIEHKNIPVETVNVNLKRKPAWLFEMNPIGLVPVLQWGSHVLYESGACNEYLDEAFPGEKLTPSDPYLRARDKQLWESMNKLISSFYDVARTRGEDKKVFDRMMRAFTRYEKELVARGQGPYFGGPSVCMADFMLWPWFERLPVVNTLVPAAEITSSNFPRLAQWIKHMYELPAVKKTLFDKEAHAQFLFSLQAGNPDYNIGLTEPAKL